MGGCFTAPLYKFELQFNLLLVNFLFKMFRFNDIFSKSSIRSPSDHKPTYFSRMLWIENARLITTIL